MTVDGFDRKTIARIALAQVAQEALISHPVSRDLVLQIHGLNAEIEPPDRRIGGLGRDGVFFAKDWRIAVDQERGARAGIDENGLADHDPFKGLKFDT